MISYAQNFEDVILWRALKSVPAGHYVDVGAFHPEIDSVTKWFYDQGWSGINLEPVPEMFAVLSAERPRDTNLQIAAADFSGEAEMAVVPDSMGLSSLDIPNVDTNVRFPRSLIRVPVLPLRDVLQLYGWPEIHFLKVDAEGTEEAVLRGMDFVRFRPWIVVVEATAPMTETRTSAKWQEHLTEHAYSQAYFDGLNDFYVAAERMELAARLARPPNVFDQFELAATLRERQGREELAAAVESLRAQLGELDHLGKALAAAQIEIDTLRTQLEEKRMETANLRTNVVRLDEQFTTLRRAHAELREEQVAVQLHNRALRSDLDTSEKSIIQLGADLAELATGLRHNRETCAALERQLQQVVRSRSFRWLAPARRLRAALLPRRQ
jgi:FkbM family methyltransferase